MIKYTITRWDSDTAMKARTHVVRYRSDAARNALWSAIYEMCAADGMLDRPIAHKLMAQFDACDTSAPARGYYRTETFTLRNYGAHVKFWAERI